MRFDRRTTALAFSLAALAIGFFALRPKPTGGPPMRDFESYWSAGRAASAGRNPYGRAVWREQRTIPGVLATRDEILPFVGPPYGLPLWRLLGTMPFGTAIVVWGVVLGLSVVTIAIGSLALAGSRLPATDVVATAVLCAGFGPLTSGVGLGQVAVASTAGTIAAVLVAGRSRVRLFCAALAAALQPNLALALAALLGTSRAARARALPLAVAAGVALAVAQLQPFGSLRAYLALLHEHGEAERFIAIQTTLAAIARGFGVPAIGSIVIGDALALAVVALAAVQCFHGDRSTAERFAIACAALPFALPFSHEHDFTIAFFPALYAVRRARGATLGLATIGTLFIAVDWIGLAQRPTGVLESACLAVAAACALAALADDGRLVRYGGLAVVPLVVVLGFTTHALPTWPDALATTYQAPAAWDVTRVWFDEQRHSGIAALDPWWSLLRALSLAGCGIVWLAVLRCGRGRSGAGATAPRSASGAEPPRSSRLSTPPGPVAAGRPSS